MNRSPRIDEFVSLLNQNAPRIYGLIRALIHQRADAEDVFQETCCALWQKFDQYQSGSNFLAWAFSVSRIEVLRQRRKLTYLPKLSEDVYQLLDQSVERLADSFDFRQSALTSCLEQLPAEDRELLNARYSSGSTVQSMAERAGRSVDAIYRSLRRIHGELFKCIGKRIREEAGQ